MSPEEEFAFMYLAKVKYPYKKDWEKDLGYGLSAPITLENEELGDYKQYVNASDPEKQWVRELKKGDMVFLEKNSNGNGYIIKRKTLKDFEDRKLSVKSIENTSPVGIQGNNCVEKELEQVKNSAKILGECIKEIESQIAEAKTQFSGEDVRCLAISMFIQLMRSKKSGFDYSVN